MEKKSKNIYEPDKMDAEEEYWNALLKIIFFIIDIIWAIDLYYIYWYRKTFTGLNKSLIIINLIGFILFQPLTRIYFLLFDLICIGLVYLSIFSSFLVGLCAITGFYIKMDNFNHHSYVVICSINIILFFVVFIIIQLYHSDYVIFVAKKKQPWRIVSFKELIEIRKDSKTVKFKITSEKESEYAKKEKKNI